MQILLNLNKTKIIKNIKDVIIGVFVVIGFVAIVIGFTNEAEQEPTAVNAFAINKQER